VEWTVNSQYHYGYAVPFLCLYLLGKSRNLEVGNQKSEGGGGKAETLKAEKLKDGGREETTGPRDNGGKSRNLEIGNWKPTLLLALVLALAWLPTRLIEEANPEWRLVSWALAFEVIGLTLFIAHAIQALPALPSPLSALRSPVSTSPVLARRLAALGPCFSPRSLLFPAAFFLVAVPWPTFLESPLIQGLTRANTFATVEILGVFGVPALQHGNIIEVAAGAVGVDEACSGIRSLQATLMLSLFFGEVFRLAIGRRLALCAAGFALAFVFNVARTTVLTWIAAIKGLAAMNAWHDAAGTAILIACFVSLALLSRWLRPRAAVADPATTQRPESPALPLEPVRATTIQNGRSLGDRNADFQSAVSQTFGLHSASFCGGLQILHSPLILIPAWILLAEIATESWYRLHERHLPPPITWSVSLPIDNASYKPEPFSERVPRFLRYDEGVRGGWQGDDGARWQAIFLRWNAGRTAVNLASSHTPEACVTASGRELIDKSDIRFLAVDGLRLPFRFYTFRDESGPLHVAYCLWQDRGDEAPYDPTSAGYANRLAHVLAGRRNCGQRSLELAVWGIDDNAAAETALGREIGKLVKGEENKR
jgi:exosortase